jgi:hypothetical protein
MLKIGYCSMDHLWRRPFRRAQESMLHKGLNNLPTRKSKECRASPSRFYRTSPFGSLI